MNIVTKTETAKGKVVYTLFSEPSADPEKDTYGIAVRSELFGEPEEAAVKDITTQRESAEKLLFTLADNLVLPSTLGEVVEEYVSASLTV